VGGTFRAVRAMAAREIERLSDEIRSALRLGTKGVQMGNLLETVLREVLPDYDFFVLPDEDMPGMAGVTTVGERTIYLSNSTYLALCDGKPDARLVAAHEFGHLMLHSHQKPSLAKRTHDDDRVDPEWQADRFAEFWLMPRDGVAKCRSARHVAAKYSVPDDVASRRFEEVKQIGIQGELF
jgi:Zn-dependent peptidase ImmA (M78 family)